MNNILFNIGHPIRGVPQKGQMNLDSQKFERLLKSSERVFIKISSIFPFDFFPDEISIDECKISIVFHEFFLSEDVHSIAIDMIKDIEVEAGPLFATLKIVPDGFPGRPLVVRYLKKKEAIRARRIIEGLIVTRRQGIDTVKLDSLGLDREIELIGSTHFSE